jgi:Skp family chaperone for outer membrane proteins
MKKFRLLPAVLFVAVLSAVSALAQTTTQSSVSTRFAVINTAAFGDAKSGITRYTTAINKLIKEFEPDNIELKAMGTRYENLRKEIERLQAEVAKIGSPIPQSAVQAKIEEFDKLGRDIKFKQEDLQARSQSRYNAIMSPVLQDIAKAIQDYAKQRGFALILDGAKLDEIGLVLGVGDDKIDVTKDFIAFYNARPAGATVNSSPK